jgi:16S rRNA processing protein RimM
MMKEYFECGKILAPHGVRGLVKVDSWCDSPKILAAQKRVFFARGEGYTEAKVLSASVSGPVVLMNIEGIGDRETAQGMKGNVIYLKREDIPIAKGAHFLADIIGLPALEFTTGAALGRIKDITEGVGNRIYVIETPSGKDALVPDVDVFIKEIDLERGVKIATIPGLFEEL